MIISHKYKIVFIHIPKTAGSYIKDILQIIDPQCLTIDYHGEKNIYGHQPFFLIKTLDIYKDIKNYTFFSVIRDPEDLLISHYNYIHTALDSHYLYKDIKNKSFSESINTLLCSNKGLFLFFIANECNFHVDNDYNYDTEFLYNNINRQIKLLNFKNIRDELKTFLTEIGVPSNELQNINFTAKINESIKKVNNTTDSINYLYINEDGIKSIELNRKIYNSLQRS